MLAIAIQKENRSRANEEFLVSLYEKSLLQINVNGKLTHVDYKQFVESSESELKKMWEDIKIKYFKNLTEEGMK